MKSKQTALLVTLIFLSSLTGGALVTYLLDAGEVHAFDEGRYSMRISESGEIAWVLNKFTGDLETHTFK